MNLFCILKKKVLATIPLSKTDLQCIAKNYADSKGRILHNVVNNKPGIDWVDGLLKLHQDEVPNRLATNIKRSRASVSKQTLQVISKYFHNFKFR